MCTLVNSICGTGARNSMSSRRARCECQGMVAVGGSGTVLAAMCQEIWFYSTRIRRAGSAMIVEAAKGGHRSRISKHRGQGAAPVFQRAVPGLPPAHAQLLLPRVRARGSVASAVV